MHSMETIVKDLYHKKAKADPKARQDALRERIAQINSRLEALDREIQEAMAPTEKKLEGLRKQQQAIYQEQRRVGEKFDLEKQKLHRELYEAENERNNIRHDVCEPPDRIPTNKLEAAEWFQSMGIRNITASRILTGASAMLPKAEGLALWAAKAGDGFPEVVLAFSGAPTPAGILHIGYSGASAIIHGKVVEMGKCNRSDVIRDFIQLIPRGKPEAAKKPARPRKKV